MCRTDRRCPNCGGRTAAEKRNSARIRKQRSVAGQQLREALANGATAAAHAAEQQLRAIEGGDATANKILADLPRAQHRPEMATEAPAPATPAVPAVAAESHGNEDTSPVPAPEELVQTKTGSPARIDAWLTDLQRQGYKIVSTSETQTGRNLRVTAKYIKIPPAPSGPAVHYGIHKVGGSTERWLDQIKAQGFEVHTTTAPNRHGDMRPVAEVRRTAPDPGTDPRAVEALTRAAYKALANVPQDWIPLRVMRTLIGGDRETVDSVLHALEKTGEIVLAPESNRKVLTDADHAAAVQRGSEAQHLLAFELEEYLD